MSNSAIVEKIRKLLTLANNHAATSNEAEVALEKARKLMLEHGINEIPTEKQERMPIIEGPTVITDHNWQLHLFINVAHFFGCRTYGWRSEGKHIMCGRRDYVEVAMEMYSYLLNEIEARYKLALKALRDEAGTLTREIRADLRKSFKASCAMTVGYRMQAIIAAQKKTSESRALVVIDTAAQEAADYVEQATGGRKGRALKVVSSGIGTIAGRIAGEQIKLQTTVK